MGLRIGIDLGGTKIEGIALDALGAEKARQRIRTPTDDYAGTIEAIAQLVADLESNSGPAQSIGIGIPGTLSPATGLVKNANSTCLIGHALDRDLEAALNRPVRLANDANCFTISEATDGAAQGAGTVFGVILGTGVGGGVFIEGQVLTGANAIAGEWGHNPLPWPQDRERPGPSCYCGQNGCIETFVSGTGLARDYSQATTENLTAERIVDKAQAGDNQALAALQRYESRLARALASVINILDPELIVLGGGMSNVPRLYDTVPDLWREWVFSDQVRTKLVANHHGDSSGVRGAAWLWPDPL